jgi:hypothetical protein
VELPWLELPYRCRSSNGGDLGVSAPVLWTTLKLMDSSDRHLSRCQLTDPNYCFLDAGTGVSVSATSRVWCWGKHSAAIGQYYRELAFRAELPGLEGLISLRISPRSSDMEFIIYPRKDPPQTFPRYLETPTY